MLYEVAILEKPTQKEAEEGKAERLVFGPKPIDDWQTLCPRWRYTLGKSDRKGKCRGGKCTDFLRKLIDGGHMAFNRFDYFFYVYLGWWHENIIIFRRSTTGNPRM